MACEAKMSGLVAEKSTFDFADREQAPAAEPAHYRRCVEIGAITRSVWQRGRTELCGGECP